MAYVTQSPADLRKRVAKECGWFWDNVTRTCTIDLSSFGYRSVQFTYLDPVFVWLLQCSELLQHDKKLLWEAQVLKNSSGDELFGSGVQYGLLMRAAHTSIPNGGVPALMNLSWDGGDTGFAQRSACPICLQVMNTNCGSKHAVGLLGYLPKIEVSQAEKPKQTYKDASFHVQQTCIGHILKLIERYAQHGFRGSLHGIEMLFFPRLCAMTLDTMERVKYFGLRSIHSCGHCTLRNGRSATRRSRRHNPQDIQRMLKFATQEVHTQDLISHRARIRAKLFRHGFDYKHRCRLPDFADNCLVHVPEFPNVLFQGLCQFERLHTFYIVYCEYFMELVTACLLPNTQAKVAAYVKQCHAFRDPVTGIAHPALQTILKMNHLTAERRVRAIFYWAHVLGTTAEVAVPPMRTHILVALSTLQLMLISTRGHRPYTRRELNVIYHEVGRQFFTALEALAAYADDKRMQSGLEAHRRRPNHTRPPVPFKRMRRFVHTSNKSNPCMYLHFEK